MKVPRPTTVGPHMPLLLLWPTVSALRFISDTSLNINVTPADEDEILNEDIPLSVLPSLDQSFCLFSLQLVVFCPGCRSAPSPSTTAGKRPSG